MRKSIFLFAILIVNFCVDKQEKYEEKILKNSVRKYLATLVDVYRDFNIERLDEVCAEEEKKRIDVLILTMRTENKFLDAKLKELTFGGIKRKDDNTVEVFTEEKWEFRHLDIKTKSAVDLLKTEEYKMIYTLVKQGGKWLVE